MPGLKFVSRHVQAGFDQQRTCSRTLAGTTRPCPRQTPSPCNQVWQPVKLPPWQLEHRHPPVRASLILVYGVYLADTLLAPVLKSSVCLHCYCNSMIMGKKRNATCRHECHAIDGSAQAGSASARPTGQVWQAATAAFSTAELFGRLLWWPGLAHMTACCKMLYILLWLCGCVYKDICVQIAVTW